MTMLDDAGGAAASEPAGLPAVLEPRALVPAEVFAPGGVEALLSRIEREVRAVRADISTQAGRDQVRSLAYKIARSKTALDAMGKGLTDDARAKIDSVNAERRIIRERMDALAEEARRPLTEYENAEKERVAGHERALSAIAKAPDFYASADSGSLEMRLEHLQNIAANPPRDWQEFAQRAAAVIGTEIAFATTALDSARKREAEAAELARLRAEEAERARQEAARLQAEREARIAAEAAERAKREAEERAAHAARVAAEQAEAERRAAERQRRDAEERAARAEAAAAEAARRAEADRIAAVEAERRRVAQAEEAARQAEAARAADRAHRGRINKAAADALVALGLPDDLARQVVTAIVAGSVPAVSIRY